MKKILITGSAGFIGFHLVELLRTFKDIEIVGIDNLNDYYDVNLKSDRLKESGIEAPGRSDGLYHNFSGTGNYNFIKMDITNSKSVLELFEREKFDIVINLAAQAGVRYSTINPSAYISSNILGFFNILEACRHFPVAHLIYASSSSVYGANKVQPFSVHHNVDHPISLYAATKKSNELLAYSYSHIFNIPVTGLRFFTVYGPWGRPDMAMYLFTKAISEEQPLKVYNYGNMKRDFTYISDIITSISRLLDKAPSSDSGSSDFDSALATAPYRLLNIGGSHPIDLNYFIFLIESELGKSAKKEFLPIQPGDVPETFADISELVELIGFSPKVSIEEGVKMYVAWYKEYYLNSPNNEM